MNHIISVSYTHLDVYKRQALEEGKKCPVCGSIHHPHPAVRAGRIVGQEEVKAAEQDLRKIRKEIAEQEKRLFVLERQEESCKNGLRKLGAESQKGEKSKKGGGDPKKWLERAEEFKTGRNTAVNSRKIFREEAEQAHAAFESAMENFRTACRTQGFETDEEFRAACLPDERLKEQKERIQSLSLIHISGSEGGAVWTYAYAVLRIRGGRMACKPRKCRRIK